MWRLWSPVPCTSPGLPMWLSTGQGAWFLDALTGALEFWQEGRAGGRTAVKRLVCNLVCH